MAKLLMQLWNDERGQDIAEYAVMLALIIVVCLTAISVLGGNANKTFSNVASAIGGGGGGS